MSMWQTESLHKQKEDTSLAAKTFYATDNEVT